MPPRSRSMQDLSRQSSCSSHMNDSSRNGELPNSRSSSPASPSDEEIGTRKRLVVTSDDVAVIPLIRTNSNFNKRIKRIKRASKPRKQSGFCPSPCPKNCIPSKSLIIHPTISLPLLVLIDMFAVSLVVPLLFQYYQRAGVHNANQREFLSSLFSTAQIIGGLSMGILTDGGAIQRRTLLLFSFGGSALSYALIVYGGLPALIVSRVLVGLVKQTMTVTTTILTKITTTTDRAKHMGRLTASSTVAWIVGPSFGALLYKYVDHRAPAFVACALFVLNMLLVLVLLKDDDHMEQYMIKDSNIHHKSKSSFNEKAENEISCHHNEQPANEVPTVKKSKGFRQMITNLRTCFSSKVLGAVIITKLIIAWVGQATNYGSLGSFYEDMYGLEPHHRGYISSYQQALQFIVQSLLVERVLHWGGGERKIICLFTGLMAIAVALEARRSLPLFLIVLCPIISLCFSMMNLSLQTLTTHVAPTEAIFSVLAALDVLLNIAHVSVPFYRTILFRFLRPPVEHGSNMVMEGDPDPVSWVLSSGAHWCVAAIFVSYVLLFSNATEWEAAENSNHQARKPAKKGN